jgi:uncharacterized protein YndB with AHSA1/START domain
MEKIFHYFDVNASASKVYDALVNVNGLKKWWTSGTSGDGGKGGELVFSFHPNWRKTMNVITTNKNKKVVWKCVEGPKEWIGTTLTFTLSESKGMTRVKFVHDKWRKANDFFGHCNYHWGYYMRSLKLLCETRERDSTQIRCMKTVDVNTEVIINCPIEKVAAFTSDPDNATKWYVNIKEVEWRTPKPLQKGSLIAFKAQFLGRQLAYVYEVVEDIPKQKFVMQTADGPSQWKPRMPGRN